MSVYNFLAEKVMLPLGDIVTNRSMASQIAFLERSQWWSAEELRAFQEERLRILIQHAWDNVPYWREVMKARKLQPQDIRNIEDLHKLPVLTKDEFKANYPHKMMARNQQPKSYYSAQSSGSTGTPIQYRISREASGLNKACNLRGWGWMGFRLGDKLIKVSQNKRGSFEKRLQDRINRCLLIHQTYTQENLERFAKALQQFKPDFLRSYPDPLLFFSSQIDRMRVQLPPLRGINTTGNTLFPEVREQAERVFGTRIFDSYSCESGANVFECSTHECYHSSMEYGITEIVDDNGQEVPDGGKGRLLSTDLWNFATPFIRYDSKDIVVKADKPCSCGRALLPIKQILGRDNDILVTPDGQFMIAQTFTTYFKYIPSVCQFQVVQNEPDHLLFKLVVQSDYPPGQTQAIINEWTHRVNGAMRVEVQLVEDIPPLPSGKLRFLIRNKDIHLNW